MTHGDACSDSCQAGFTDGKTIWAVQKKDHGQR